MVGTDQAKLSDVIERLTHDQKATDEQRREMVRQLIASVTHAGDAVEVDWTGAPGRSSSVASLRPRTGPGTQAGAQDDPLAWYAA